IKRGTRWFPRLGRGGPPSASPPALRRRSAIRFHALGCPSGMSNSDESGRLLHPGDDAFDRLPPETAGAPATLRRLVATAQRGRLPHALLLAGPRGSGKRWCAVRLAEA